MKHGGLQGGITRYCCLGVLCEISGEGQWFPYTEHNDGFAFHTKAGEDPCTTILPESVAKAAGLRDEGGGSIDWRYPGLVQLNDREELSFKEIADVLEQNPDFYFKEAW